MNIISTEVELFAIRSRINQAVKVPNIEQIIVITDTIPAVRQYFDLSTILINYTPLLYLKTLEPSLTRTLIILFCFGIALAAINGLLI